MRCSGLVTMLVAAGLCGCGGGDSAGAKQPASGSGTAGATAESKADAKPAAESTPAAAKVVLGGDSPADVVKRAKAAADANDVATLLAVVEPTERKAIVAMMGLMPQVMRMLKPMLAMMGGMAGGMAGAMGDPEAAAKAKAEAEKKSAAMVADLDKLILEMDGVCKAHKLDLPSMEELGINPMAGDPDPAELLKKLGTKLDHLDEGAFVTAMSAAMQKLKTILPESKGSSPIDDLKGKFGQGALADLKESGDRATGTLDGRPLEFCKAGGRWFLRGLLKRRGGASGGDSGDSEGMGGGEDDGEDG